MRRQSCWDQGNMRQINFHCWIILDLSVMGWRNTWRKCQNIWRIPREKINAFSVEKYGVRRHKAALFSADCWRALFFSTDFWCSKFSAEKQCPSTVSTENSLFSALTNNARTQVLTCLNVSGPVKNPIQSKIGSLVQIVAEANYPKRL